MAEEFMLTTVDNPFNPFTDFDKWFVFDLQAGYNTPGLLARITVTSSSLSEEEQEAAIDEAMDEIVRENVLGVHRKVSRDSFSVVGT